MDRAGVTARRVTGWIALLAAGAIGTLAITVGGLAALQPLRPFAYDALYLTLGPWTASETTTVLAFGVALAVGIGAPAIAATAVLAPTRPIRPFAVALALGTLIIATVLVIAALLGVGGFLAAIAAIVALVVAVPIGLHRLGAPRRALLTVAGSVPVVVIAVGLLGFGLGWGGGYYLTAEAVPSASVDTPDASFDEVPTVRDDLFAPRACSPYDDGVCRLPLRGYEHEVAAARFMARHGVRCPLGASPASGGRESFVAIHDDTPYRVTCVGYGD